MCHYQVTLTKGVIQIREEIVDVANASIASEQVGATDLKLINEDNELYEYSGLDQLREEVKVKVRKYE